MANGIHEADELTLIGWQLGMMRGHHTAEGGNNPITLVQHHARHVIVDDEASVEVGQLQEGHQHQLQLEGHEGRVVLR